MAYKGVEIIIRDSHGNVLLLYKNRVGGTERKMGLGLFGGKIRDGESPIEAIVREVDFGLDLDINPSHLKLVTVIEGKDYKYYIYEYTRRVNPGEIYDEYKGESLRFFSKKDISKDRRCLPYIRRLLR